MTSQINPNNIDGNYPVPGVPNNTQGFRSNFTETRTNFQYAAQEITALQNSGVFKAALPGTTLDNNMNDNLLYAVKLQDMSFTYLPVAATAGNIAIDYSAAPFQQITTTGSISLSFVNWPAAGSAGTVKVVFNITNTAHTVTLPAVVTQGLLGLQGVSPGTPGVTNIITFGAVGNYAFEFVTTDGGATVWIFDNSRANDIFTSPVIITAETASTTTATGALVVDGGAGIAGNLHAGGNIVSTGVGKIGYSAGGAVTQATDKTTGVTLNAPTGQITMNAATLAGDTTVSFTLTNSTIANTDVMILNQVGGGNVGLYNLNAVCNSGSASIAVHNMTNTSRGDAIVIRYAVIRGAVA